MYEGMEVRHIVRVPRRNERVLTFCCLDLVAITCP